jgi:alginate O-acetyltransferase complex protein AlgI
MFMPHARSLQTPPWGLVFGNRDLATMLLGVLVACIRWPRSRSSLTSTLRAAWAGKLRTDGARAMIIPFAASLCLLVASVAAIVSSDYSPFLYFRF